MASPPPSFLLRVLGFAPVRAVFLWLGLKLESVIRTYFFVRQQLLPSGSGVGGRGRYQAVIEDGLQRATPAEREAMLAEFMRLAPSDDRERLARWVGRYLAEDRDTTALERILEHELEWSTPARKQRLYGWVEDRSTQDQYTVTYAERIFDWMRAEVTKHRGSVRGLRILELGPGHTLVPGILFYVNGARSYTGVDLFPIAGKASDLYRRARDHLERRAPLLPLADPSVKEARAEALRRFDEVAKLDGPEVVLDETKVCCRYPVDAAKLPFPDASFDVVLSNASFEHFSDPVAAVRECTRVMAPGGLALHQIDLRDHRDFSNPLEFLRYEEADWKDLYKDKPFCFTNRFRKSDFERAFAESGLVVSGVEVNMKTTLDPTLRARLHPRFRDRSQEDLEAVSAFFVLRKPETPAAVLAS
ncbi:MAG: methyltransferase domain-containing protein [Planctomycetota bacterium]